MDSDQSAALQIVIAHQGESVQLFDLIAEGIKKERERIINKLKKIKFIRSTGPNNPEVICSYQAYEIIEEVLK